MVPLSPNASPVRRFGPAEAAFKGLPRSIAVGYAHAAELPVQNCQERCQPDCQIDRMIRKNPLVGLTAGKSLEMKKKITDQQKEVFRKHFIAAAEKSVRLPRRKRCDDAAGCFVRSKDAETLITSR